MIDFVYIDWDTGNSDKDWDGILRAHERIRVRWLDVGGKSDEDWDITPPATQWVKVIGKKVDGKLEGLNAFLKVEIAKGFYRNKQTGWSAFKLE